MNMNERKTLSIHKVHWVLYSKSMYTSTKHGFSFKTWTKKLDPLPLRYVSRKNTQKDEKYRQNGAM